MKIAQNDRFDRRISQLLDDIHTALDTAVLNAYNWPHTLTGEKILESLLALNLERAAHK